VFLPAKTRNRDQQRLALLVRSGEIFHQSLDVTETLNNVARLAVESFAELCLFDLMDERSDRLFVTASAHRDPSKEQALSSVQSILYVEEFGVHPVVQVTRTGEPFFLPHIDEETLIRHAASRQHERYMRQFEYRSKIVVPVVSQNQIFGALTFVRTEKDDEFDHADLEFAIELGRRAGVAVANAKQFHRERYVAETLQRAFLPRHFPSRRGLNVTAHYRPGSTEADIGGDWYDAFEDSRGNIVLTIGDVTGKGIEAARLMVLMRQAIRVAALDSDDPAHIAGVCNRLLLNEGGERFASAFVGILDSENGELRYVSAGHAPPLLRRPDGTILKLEPPSAPLGAFRDIEFARHQIFCPPGSVLALYTDGVIEIDRDVPEGERRLEGLLRCKAVLYAANPAEFLERVIRTKAPRDDIAILVVAFTRRAMRWRFEAADARTAYSLRNDYLGNLQRVCSPQPDDLSMCGVIFAELIGNAVRHAPGPLSVSLEFRGDDVFLHVIDKGPGFSFEPSLPADIWAESGRGLYLVSRLAQKVEVERIPEAGSHISVQLPVRCKSPFARATTTRGTVPETDESRLRPHKATCGRG
jgi:serine phosphatase RsbU (regulator of sigma subunit)/anti-sigma regulatory factor (Ser/Thr protein kinase)